MTSCRVLNHAARARHTLIVTTLSALVVGRAMADHGAGLATPASEAING
jgi:hypothetical protein